MVWTGLAVSWAYGATPQKPAAPPSLDKTIRAEVEAALSMLQKEGDYPAAQQALQKSFDQVIQFCPARNKTLFRDVAFARRLVSLLPDAAEDQRAELLTLFRNKPRFAQALLFLIKPQQESAAKVFALAHRLAKKNEAFLDDFATLAAAICVVHDVPFSQRVNENSAKAEDPLALFDYFRTYEKHMLFGMRRVPAELLIYVVNCGASIPEMKWALKKYAGDKKIGRHFFDIKYDDDHLRLGTPKKVTEAGWNLINILKHGGVCADQAYFAMTIGKSIGVPTTYNVGASAVVGHAWVGFLEARGKRAAWNFDSGRYGAYKGVRGNVQDPQIRRNIPDSFVSLLAAFVAADELDRYYVAATNDAVHRMIERQKVDKPLPPAPANEARTPIRGIALADQLALLEAGLRACPGYSPSWLTLRDLAEEDKLSLTQKKEWAGVLHRLCGSTYPDFYLEIVAPMILTIKDVKEQNSLWNKAFKTFSRRSDLAATVRMKQAKMWQDHGEDAKAGKCYHDVFTRYANAGPFAVRALRETETILEKLDKVDRIVPLYAKAWASIKRPKGMASQFARQSNWFRVGTIYADRLEAANDTKRAQAVRKTLGISSK